MRQISIDKVIEMLLSLTDRQTDRQTEVSLSYLNTFFYNRQWRNTIYQR